MSWAWEYQPNALHVVSGIDPAFIAQVEKLADKLVRAAEALYVTRY